MTFSDEAKAVNEARKTDKKYRYVIYKVVGESVIDAEATGERSAPLENFLESCDREKRASAVYVVLATEHLFSPSQPPIPALSVTESSWPVWQDLSTAFKLERSAVQLREKRRRGRGQSAGVTVSEGAKTAYDELRRDKKHRYVLFKLTEGNVIETDTTGERSATVADFLEKLQHSYADQCRWVVFDHTVKREDGATVDQKVFICWSPEQANVRQKMIYSSSKNILRVQLVGISRELKASGVEEIELE
ncbi:hypothetical protein HPB51_006889 [Rhipicephalus microplus]|uniref:ADF-H domain-containing protein n=1 Tax=Rhipicephalus microplus TaxID=6941 RepID=A0A9J6E8A4_RHIMP|nr:hypothetical protein HPB51_006889 [Rhipicephalus microplus]